MERTLRIQTPSPGGLFAELFLFLRRFLGWYLWLGLFTTALGALVGVLVVAFLISLVFAFIAIVPSMGLGLTFAAPLGLAALPLAFHALRTSPYRPGTMGLIGAVGGFISPIAVTLAWEHVLGPPSRSVSGFTGGR
jgi:hypothetical protein